MQLHRFKRKTEGRPPGSVNQNHRYRKGIAGDWRNYFTAALIAEFKKRCNAGLLKLGYETDPDWT